MEVNGIIIEIGSVIGFFLFLIVIVVFLEMRFKFIENYIKFREYKKVVLQSDVKKQNRMIRFMNVMEDDEIIVVYKNTVDSEKKYIIKLYLKYKRGIKVK